MMIDEAMFVDECRRYHPELTDDQLRTVYAIYRDEWSYPSDHIPHDCDEGAEGVHDERHIFNVLFRISGELLRVTDDRPLVKFRHLFRWRELTQTMGEDLPACAALAWLHKDREPYDFRRHGAPGARPYIDFGGWPTVLHNDNPDLRHIFETVGLCELHSHLKASTDTFGITWICLMNHIGGRKSQFEELARTHDQSRYKTLADSLHSHAAQAVAIRAHIWKHILTGRGTIAPLPMTGDLEPCLTALDKTLSEMRVKDSDFDYIPGAAGSKMEVFAGERMLLYGTLERIIRSDDILLRELFYRYILIKNRIRAFLVQVNDNRGFDNFRRFQDLKSTFLLPRYRELLTSLPMWEAREFNYARSFEARITPTDKGALARTDRIISAALADRGDDDEATSEAGKADEGEERLKRSFIFHFIKVQDQGKATGSARDRALRSSTALEGATIKRLLSSEECRKLISAIDAASSEIACRPEAFAQVFRFLKAAGYSATFHAGEDFYDIADGLRAIFETVHFLGLEAGDRIGHAIALGIDPQEFYGERHNYIALPAQWMLDNAVWLYFYAREHNVMTDPATENFLLTEARRLLTDIGYEKAYGERPVELSDYYRSILLRGDDPEAYREGCFSHTYALRSLPDGESWHGFALQRSERAREIRAHSPNAAMLYSIYHFDGHVRERGRRIKSFRVPEGYAGMIRDLQTSMMREICKRQLGIECCPSSNLKIGRLHRFDRHPIFRFMPVRADESRYPLAVTVNTDDLGIFATSLPNEFSLLALALLKTKDSEGKHRYSSREVYDWIRRVVENGHKYRFALAGKPN